MSASSNYITRETPSADSIRSSVTIASAIMMGSVFLSRVLGIVREMVLASYGGTQSQMDAYVAAFLLPEVVNHLLAGGFMSVTFIPIFQKHLAQNRRDLAWQAFSNLLTTGTVLLGILIAIGMLFTETVLGLLGKRIADPQQLALTARMTRIVLPGQLFFYWGALLLAVQYAEKRFFIPALAPLVYNAGIILGGVALSPFLGMEGFAWGVLLGSFVGNFLLQAYGAKASGMAFSFRIDSKDPDLRTYVLVTLPLVLGLGMQFSIEIFFRIFGSFLPTGAIASLNYSLRAMMALVAVFGQAFGVAAFPYLSQYVTEKRFAEMNKLLFSMLTKVAVIMIPFSLLMMVLSSETLAVLFQRGRFTAASTLATAPVLSMFCIGAFGLAATNMISRGFYALQNTFLPMVVSSIATFCSLPLYWFFMVRNGAPGIALVASIFMLVQFFVLMVIWTKRYNATAELQRLLVTLLKIVVVSAIACALAYAIASSLAHASPLQGLGTLLRNLAVLFISGVPAIALMFFAFDLLGIADFRALMHRVLRKRSAPPPKPAES